MTFDFWDFAYPVQDALQHLQWDIRDGLCSDFDEQTICTYQHMQTLKVCRRQRTRVDLMVELADWLDDQWDVYLWGCFVDSLGDQWMQLHPYPGQEAA